MPAEEPTEDTGIVSGISQSEQLGLQTEDLEDVAVCKEKPAHAVVLTTIDVNIETTKTAVATETNGSSDQIQTTTLLDNPPDRFEFGQNMLHSHFAHYNFNGVRNAVGRTQTMLLRHLVERFEKTGKELLYYYIVPRLCKQTYPPSEGETFFFFASTRYLGLHAWKRQGGVASRECIAEG